MTERLSKHPLICLFAALTVAYLFTYRGNIDVIDEAMMMGVTGQLVDGGSFQLNAIYPALLPWGAPSSDPAHPIYSKYALGQSVLAAPLYALGRLIPINTEKLLNEQPYLPLVPFLTALLLNLLLTLLCAWAVYRTVLLWGYSQRTGAILVILFALTTLAWPYAKTFYAEPATACALAWMAFFAVRSRSTESAHPRRDGLLAGASLGIAIFVRTTSVLFAPLLVLYLVPAIFSALPGIAFGLGLTVLYNFARFGSLTETGYEAGFGRAPWEALLGYLVSPSRSFFLFNPVLLLSIPGAGLLWRRIRRDVLFIGALIVAQVGIYSAWWAWDGGASLGARFLVPVIPLAALLLAPIVASRRWRPVWITLAALGFAMQVLSNLANPNDVFFETVQRQAVTLSQVNWNWQLSIPANLWNAYANHAIDSLLLRYLPPNNPVGKAILFALLAVVILGVATWAALRLPGEAPELVAVGVLDDPV